MPEPYRPRSPSRWLCDVCWWPTRGRWAMVTAAWTMRGHRSCMNLFRILDMPSIVTRLDYSMKGAPDPDDPVLH